MKEKIILMLVLFTTGCSERVSVTAGAGDASIRVRGSSHALEKKAEAIRAESCVTGSTNSALGWRKLQAIQDTLLERNYFGKQSFILPAFPVGAEGEHLATFARMMATNTPQLSSCVAEASYESTHEDNAVLRITVIDRPSSIQEWHDYLKTLDAAVRIEQSLSP